MIEANSNYYMNGLESPVQMLFPQASTFWPHNPNYFQNQAGNQTRYQPLPQSTPGIYLHICLYNSLFQLFR